MKKMSNKLLIILQTTISLVLKNNICDFTYNHLDFQSIGIIIMGFKYTVRITKFEYLFLNFDNDCSTRANLIANGLLKK